MPVPVGLAATLGCAAVACLTLVILVRVKPWRARMLYCTASVIALVVALSFAIHPMLTVTKFGLWGFSLFFLECLVTAVSAASSTTA